MIEMNKSKFVALMKKFWLWLLLVVIKSILIAIMIASVSIVIGIACGIALYFGYATFYELILYLP